MNRNLLTIQEWFEIGMKRTIPDLIPVGERVANLGAGEAKLPGARNLDLPEWDATRPDPLPFADESLDTIFASHFFEHLYTSSIIGVLREAQRVLRTGGALNIITPYYNSQLQAQDLTHRSAFAETTWDVLLHNRHYVSPGNGLQFSVHAVFIIGVVERNLALFTQLERT